MKKSIEEDTLILNLSKHLKDSKIKEQDTSNLSSINYASITGSKSSKKI
jgi:hypothetical protein